MVCFLQKYIRNTSKQKKVCGEYYRKHCFVFQQSSHCSFGLSLLKVKWNIYAHQSEIQIPELGSVSWSDMAVSSWKRCWLWEWRTSSLPPSSLLESPPSGACNILSKDDCWRRCAGSEMSGRARPGATQTGFWHLPTTTQKKYTQTWRNLLQFWNRKLPSTKRIRPAPKNQLSWGFYNRGGVVLATKQDEF